MRQLNRTFPTTNRRRTLIFCLKLSSRCQSHFRPIGLGVRAENSISGMTAATNRGHSINRYPVICSADWQKRAEHCGLRYIRIDQRLPKQAPATKPLNLWSNSRFCPTIADYQKVEVAPPPSTLNSHPSTLPWPLENEKEKSKPCSSSAKKPAITITPCVGRWAAKSSSSRSSAPASASTRCTQRKRSSQESRAESREPEVIMLFWLLTLRS